jgi:hypothetical protein
MKLGIAVVFASLTIISGANAKSKQLCQGKLGSDFLACYAAQEQKESGKLTNATLKLLDRLEKKRLAYSEGPDTSYAEHIQEAKVALAKTNKSAELQKQEVCKVESAIVQPDDLDRAFARCIYRQTKARRLYIESLVRKLQF